MIGKILAHYEITGRLGKGGMGEVYQAKDRKLGRDVAIKVLPEEFARDTDRVARFQREAKLLASLNHPNIAAIHGLEVFEGVNFLVLELVQGATLAERIKTGPIPVEDALKLALQIAEALEAAHEKGVIHRDLKPANTKVTPEGKVKVLDFGLAKAFAGESEVNLSNSPTLSEAATQQGVILGTAAYMSPEQAKGKAVDKRADIWAFGVVLFEMLTGRPLFTGETVSETLAAVLMREPNFSTLPPNLHSRIRFLLERCLEKEPKNRYHDISDVRVDIQKVLADPGGVFAQPMAATEPRPKLRKMLPWIAAVFCLVIAGIAVWNLKQAPPPEPRRVIRLDHVLPADQQIDIPVMQFGHTLAVSPDGNQFVYTISKGIFIRSINELSAVLIPGTSGNPQSPFFSPDGQWIGYWSKTDNKLKKISVRGGAPVALCNTAWAYGAIWYPDNTIIFSDVLQGIMRVSGNGGTPEALVKGMTVAPQLLPDGKSLLFTDVEKQPYRIVVQSLKSGERKELFAGAGAHYLPTGHLVYGLQNNNNLFAVAFDAHKLEVKGGPVPIVEGVDRMAAYSDSGTLVYLPGTTATPASGNTLVWVDREGQEESLGALPDRYVFPKISPDGTRVALAIIGENPDIWVWDLARKTMTRLTFDKGSDIQPIWTPDSKQVLFFSTREGKFGGIFRKQSDGTGEDQMLVAAPDRQLFPWAMTNDGKTLVVVDTSNAASKGDISMISIEGDHARKPLLNQDEYIETQAKISPDGKWLAYVSNESGKGEVYVRPFPEVNKGRWQVSTKGGVSPLWAPNGRELFYFSEDDGCVMTVSVETGQAFSMDTPKKLFSRLPYLGGGATPGTTFDIHPDGKRFLMLKKPEAAPSAQGGPRKITIVLNWLEELKQRVPVK
jgi:serine/threonine protein kinase/Tol biopolymer transport system component